MNYQRSDDSSEQGAIYPSGLASDDHFTSTPEMSDRIARAATLLDGMGIDEGDCVALLLRNGRAFVEATLAAQHLGAYAVPINWHFTPGEIAYVLGDCGAKVLVAERDLADTVARDDGIAVLYTGDGGGDSWERSVSASAPITSPPRPAGPSMVYTSGTTGKPKGVRRAVATQQNRKETQNARQLIYKARPGMRLLLSAPLYHTAPNFFALSTIANNGLLVLQQKFDPRATLKAIETFQITHAFMVPTMFVRLLDLASDDRSSFDISSLEWVLHAGAPCPQHVKRAMIDWWGPVIGEYYGSTEAGPLTFADSADWLAHPGTVGRPLEGVELVICDDDGTRCKPGQSGEICVARAVQADFTYQGDDQKRSSMETGNGLATGDIGYFDEDGLLYLCDRKVDMIISGGVNIYPAEIEAALLEISAVADAVAVGVPDPEFGESIVAIVQPKDIENPPDTDHLLAELGGKIARYKHPRRFVFLNSLPRDDTGKVSKRKLRVSITSQ